MAVNHDQMWARFLTDHGRDLEGWVQNELERTRGLFDTDDGSHAKWVSGTQLGALLLFDVDVLAKLLAAWEEAAEHNEFAAEHVMAWMSYVMDMLERATEMPFTE